MEDLQQLEQMLRTHDWYYMMSEDSRYYRRGSEQSKAINDQMKVCVENGMKDEAEQLYAKYKKSLF
jgi:hypothetical protein